MNKASEEQKEVLKALDNNNVMLSAVAGSGKTTTALHVAKKFLDEGKKVLLITYNTKLKKETFEKAKKEGLDTSRFHIRTFHGEATVMNFNSNAGTKENIHNSYLMEEFISNVNNDKIKTNWTNYDIIILDEVQDMTPLFYELIKIVISKNKRDYKLLIMGDPNQSIYEYQGSDSRFLTMSDLIWKNKYSWKKLKLSTSYRVPKEVANFLNEIYFQDDFITGYNSKGKNSIEYWAVDTWNPNGSEWLKEARKLIDYYGIENTIILNNSVKATNSSNSPIKKFQNALAIDEKNEGYNIYISGDNDDSDEDFAKNKLLFSSYHKAKGLERKLAIVFTFDEGFYFPKMKADRSCPLNELYVAATRGSEKVILINSLFSPPLYFLNKDKLNEYIRQDFLIEKDKSQWDRTLERVVERFKDDGDTNTTFEIFNIFKHSNSMLINKAFKTLKINNIQKEEKDIKLKSKLLKEVNGKKTFENVAGINNILVPLYFQYHFQNKEMDLSILEDIEEILEMDNNTLKEMYKYFYWNKEKTKDFIKKIIDQDILNIEDLIQISIFQEYLITKSEVFINQMKDLKPWISEEDLKPTNERLYNIFSGIKKREKVIFNERIVFDKMQEVLDIDDKTLAGKKEFSLAEDIVLKTYVDAIDHENKIVYKFNYSNKIIIEDYISLAVTGFILKNKNKKFNNYHYKIFNIRTNELVEVKWNNEKLIKEIFEIIKDKNFSGEKLTDDEFLEKIGIYIPYHEDEISEDFILTDNEIFNLNFDFNKNYDQENDEIINLINDEIINDDFY